VLDGVFPAARANIDRLRRQTARLHRLVDDLTQLAQMEALTTRLKLQPPRPEDVISDDVEPLRPKFVVAGVTLDTALAGNLPRILADHDRLVQVLLDNALRFTDRGGQVRIEASSGRSDMGIAVTDSGCGIHPEDLPHIFERFFRSDRSRSRDTGGSGIGLAIVKAIVEAHGGRVQVSSQPNHGSRFEFALPVASPAMTGSPPPTRAQVAAS
jgi:signal transduction histidine kinase